MWDFTDMVLLPATRMNAFISKWYAMIWFGWHIFCSDVVLVDIYIYIFVVVVVGRACKRIYDGWLYNKQFDPWSSGMASRIGIAFSQMIGLWFCKLSILLMVKVLCPELRVYVRWKSWTKFEPSVITYKCLHAMCFFLDLFAACQKHA